MTCKARITDKRLYFQGDDSGVVFHTTTECGSPSSMTVKHHDGESSMSICKKCLPHYIKKNKWYGWFDDIYPNDAPVKGSDLYRQTVKRFGEPTLTLAPVIPKDTESNAFSMTPLINALPSIETQPVVPNPPPIPSIASLQTIESCKEARLVLKAWIRGEGAKKPSKLQPYYKADMDIVAKMKKL